jgi:hypothetical protein
MEIFPACSWHCICTLRREKSTRPFHAPMLAVRSDLCPDASPSLLILLGLLGASDPDGLAADEECRVEAPEPPSRAAAADAATRPGSDMLAAKENAAAASSSSSRRRDRRRRQRRARARAANALAEASESGSACLMYRFSAFPCYKSTGSN